MDKFIQWDVYNALDEFLIMHNHMDDTSSENETKNAETKTRGSTVLLFFYFCYKPIENQRYIVRVI